MGKLPATLPIKTENDLIQARVQVREAARLIGLNLMDQSRISMATSSLANALGMGKRRNTSGQISIERVFNHTNIGLRVTCSREITDGYAPPISYFTNERWMVDELELCGTSPDEIKITMIKWVSY